MIQYLKWRKMMKIALDHPFFEYRGEHISRKEAERILGPEFPSFEEMIEGAKKRFDLPEEAWAIYDEAIAKNAKKAAKRRR